MISRRGVKIDVSCYMIKVEYLPLPLLKNGSRAPGSEADLSCGNLSVNKKAIRSTYLNVMLRQCM